MSRAALSALANGRCLEIGGRKLTALVQAVGLDLLVAPPGAWPSGDSCLRKLQSLQQHGLEKDPPSSPAMICIKKSDFPYTSCPGRHA